MIRNFVSHNRPIAAWFHLAVGVALLGLVGCGKGRTEADIVAKVGDTEITVDQFSKQLASLQRTSPVPVDPRLLLDEMVSREVMVQAAKKAGLLDDPEVTKSLADVLISTLKARKLDAALAAVSVSDEELRAAYERDQARFTSPERVRFAVLFIAAAPDGHQRMVTALDLAKKSATEKGFGAVAVNYSEDQETRYRGGDLGWMEREHFPKRLDAAVIEAAFALTNPGDLSEIISASNGLYLVKLIERQSVTVAPLEEVAATLREQLAREKRELVAADFQKQLHSGLQVEVHAERLGSIASASPTTEPSPPPLQ